MTNTKMNKQSNSEALSEEKIPHLVLRFTMTTLTALVLNSVYTLIDALFISWGVGVNAMGAMSVVFPFVILQGAISTAVGGGAASIVSRKLGEKKLSESGNVTFNAMLVFYLSAIIITILGFILMNPLLKSLGVTDELYPLAKQYFMIILIGNIFSTGFSSIIRAEGKMLYGLLIWVIPVTINIILDAIFILGFGLGVSGAAWATVICQFTSFCMCILFFTRFTSQNFKDAKPNLKTIGEILAIGLPSLIQMGSLSIISVVLNNLLRDVSGTVGVNTFSYINKIMTFGIVPFTAVTQALAPIVGYNYGVGNTTRVKKTIVFCFRISFLYAVFAFILVVAIPEYMIRIFTDNKEIIALGAQGLRKIAITLVFTPLPMLTGAALQAVGQKLWSLILYAANLVFIIPTALIMAKYFNINGIWWAYVISNVAAAIIALIKVYTIDRHLSPKINISQM